MPVKKQIPYSSGIYFITFTCTNWIPIFEKLNCYDIVYNWFDYLKSKGHLINAFVIMPNHVHVIVSFRKTDKSINKIIGDGKRFMSYEIIKRLKINQYLDVLNQLKTSITQSDKEKGKQHTVFEPSFDWKHLTRLDFITQKLDYIHQNPIKLNFSLEDENRSYQHSSAPDYGYAGKVQYPIFRIQDTFDINLEINNSAESPAGDLSGES